MYPVTECKTIDVLNIGWGYIPFQSLCKQYPNYVSNPSNN